MFKERKKKTDIENRRTSQIRSPKRKIVRKSNTVVHGYPQVRYCNGLSNYRPGFSHGFRTALPVERGQARRHIISYEVMRSAFIRVLKANDASFNDMARLFILSHGRRPDEASAEELVMGCLRILNENPKNFVVDDFKVNSALGNILKQVNYIIMSGTYQSWLKEITGEQVIDKLINPKNGSSVDKIITNLKDAVGTRVLKDEADILKFLYLIYDNVSLDIMNKELEPDELSNMRRIFEQQLYQGFISVNNAQSLFDVCDRFMRM